MKNLDLATLRKTVTAMRLRVATLQQRDSHRNAANRADLGLTLTPSGEPIDAAEAKGVAASHRAQADALASKLGRMPRYPRQERREAERALAKAERRAAQ